MNTEELIEYFKVVGVKEESTFNGKKTETYKIIDRNKKFYIFQYYIDYQGKIVAYNLNSNEDLNLRYNVTKNKLQKYYLDYGGLWRPTRVCWNDWKIPKNTYFFTTIEEAQDYVDVFKNEHIDDVINAKGKYIKEINSSIKRIKREIKSLTKSIPRYEQEIVDVEKEIEELEKWKNIEM